MTAGPGINIQKSRKYLNSTITEQAEDLARALENDELVGRALRTLIGRLRHPDTPLTDEEAEMLLLLSIAEKKVEARKSPEP